MHQSYQSFGEYLDSLTFDFDQKKQILLNGFNGLCQKREDLIALSSYQLMNYLYGTS